MQDNSRDNHPRSPRLSQPAPPGHWAEGRVLPYHLAYGFDCLAGRAGAADGLALLLKTCELSIGQVDAALAWEFREWFYACYARYGERQTAAGDVVAAGCGIYSFDSGWCPPAHG